MKSPHQGKQTNNEALKMPIAKNIEETKMKCHFHRTDIIQSSLYNRIFYNLKRTKP